MNFISRRLFYLAFISIVFFLFDNGCKSPLDSESDEITTNDSLNIFQYNDELGRGINLGNALEAPSEGEWGITIQEEYFSIIKKAGFDNVRIPVRWSAHTAVDSPYTIDVNFQNRVDQVIYQAFNNDLKVILNIHHYNEIMANPEQEKEKLFNIWRQLSSHYQDFSLDLAFEVLNEPHDKLTPELWNFYSMELVEIIRKNNPDRPIIIGTANWGGLSALSDLKLPDDD